MIKQVNAFFRKLSNQSPSTVAPDGSSAALEPAPEPVEPEAQPNNPKLTCEFIGLFQVRITIDPGDVPEGIDFVLERLPALCAKLPVQLKISTSRRERSRTLNLEQFRPRQSSGKSRPTFNI